MGRLTDKELQRLCGLPASQLRDLAEEIIDHRAARSANRSDIESTVMVAVDQVLMPLSLSDDVRATMRRIAVRAAEILATAVPSASPLTEARIATAIAAIGSDLNPPPAWQQRVLDAVGLPAHQRTDARELDWSAAEAAGHRIARTCSDAGYVAPEDLVKLRELVVQVCKAMDQIVQALRITPPAVPR